MKFSFSKKHVKRNRDPRIKKLVRAVSRPPQVYDVHDLRNDKGKKYVGMADYRKRVIILDRTLTDKQKHSTVAHEVGHFKLREKGISSSDFGKRVREELRKTKMYKQLKKEGYERKKIPEEAFAEYYAQKKVGNQATQERLKKFEKKYPTIARKFSKLARGGK
jgi:Zn-dependent peptidase ImmA (M78 family)